jgi:phosphoadenosine phosphosulfate reductase
MRVTGRALDPLNERFREAAPLAVLHFAQETFGGRAAILCSMQRSGTTLCHLADRAGLAFDVLFVDTGVLHAETLATRDALAAAHPNLRVLTLRPEATFAEQTAAEGVLYLTKEGQERCCELRKSAPLHALRGRYDALLVPLRRDEGGARGNLQSFALDPAMNALRIHPFAWSSAQSLLVYQKEHAGQAGNAGHAGEPGVVLNPLHAMGFPSIGCFPCTTPVLPDEPERAGRWRHLAGVAYCGINPGDRGEVEEAIDLPERYAPLFA